MAQTSRRDGLTVPIHRNASPAREQTTARERILKAARQSLKQVGVKGTRVQEICASAGVSRTSFYREFRNVDEVVATLAVRRWKQTLAEVIDAVMALPTPVERWSRFIFDMARRSAEEPGLFIGGDSLIPIIELMYHDNGALLQEIVEVMRPCIESSQRAGMVRTDAGVAEIADWLLRQIWSLSSVPFPGGDADGQMWRHIECFVLPGLLKTTGASGQVLAEVQKLSQALQRIEKQITHQR